MPSPIAARPLNRAVAWSALSVLASVGLAQEPQTGHTPGTFCCANCCAADAELTPEQEAAKAFIEAQTFMALPQEHRDVIARELTIRGEPIPSLASVSRQPNEKLGGRDIPLSAKELDAAWAVVGAWEVCTRAEFAGFDPVHQRMLLAIAERINAGGLFAAAPCFTPGTDPRLVETVSDLISFGLVTNDSRFEQILRWARTAANPTGTATQGEPTTLTYSFPDDGTFVGNGVGEGNGFNDLNAFFDGIYGSRAVWRAIYDDMFARWAELSGNIYILETNDDNADVDFPQNTNNGAGIDPFPGVLGVRGDLRMVGKPIDGNSGTLAYNFFPEMGDMVIDTADGFYNNTSNDSIRLRNILAHEHGHGMGQLHTCPIQENKLMEPFISIAFDGPQFDDVLNAQRFYGDPNEPNDSILDATNLGSVAVGTSVSLGAITYAFDVRPEVAEQIESMGAEFVFLDFEEEQSDGAETG
ncbi:MAG: matrixin family metalloprotease, partial [Planctomycetota bacterium]